MELVTIGKWRVPKEMFDEYIKFRKAADSYLDGTGDVPSKTDYEKTMRWQVCVKKVMEIHLAICEAIGVHHSEDTDDEFYRAFHKAVNRAVKP